MARKSSAHGKTAVPAALPAVASALRAEAASISAAIVMQLVDEIPVYASVPRDSLEASVRQHIITAAESLELGHAPTPVRDVRIGAERAREGIPIEDVLLAIRLTFQSLRERVLAAAEAVATDPSAALAGMTVLWEVNDLVSREYAISHREEDLEMARRDEHQRAEYVRSLLSGSANASDLGLRVSALGSTLHDTYVAFRAHSSGGDHVHSLGRRLRHWAGTHGIHLLSTTIDGDLAGLASDLGALDADTPIGIGFPADLSTISRSFQEASQALEIGIQFGYTGPITLDRLSLRVAVATEHTLGSMLVNRYIAPVRARGEFGSLILRSVDAYLASRLDTAAAAELLAVHPNTLRYRINLFKDLTGVDFSCPVDMAETWWALRRTEWVAATSTDKE